MSKGNRLVTMGKKDDSKLHKLSLQGIRATGRAMRLAGQGEVFRASLLKEIGKAVLKEKAKNPVLTIEEVMADYDRCKEDAAVYAECGITRKDFRDKAEEVLHVKE